MLKAVLGENSVVYRHSKNPRNSCCKQNAVKILVVTGLFFIISGIVCAITKVFEDWVEHKVKQGVVLEPGNTVYRKWRRPETPSYMSYYMFNVTNAEEVTAGGTPNLQQLGPYTYREISERDVLTRNNYTKSSITYLSKSYYVYDKDKSCESCNPMLDNVTNVNLAFLTTVEQIIRHVLAKDNTSLPFVLAIMDETFKKRGLKAFQTISVHKSLWGRRDPVLCETHGILLKLDQSRDPNISMKIPEGFSLVRNNTVDLYTIDSGADDVDRVGEYLLWNKKAKISCWGDKYANMINGTNALRYRPYISEHDTIYALVATLFRSFKLIYDSTIRVRGIRLYRFALDPQQFITGDINGNNKGFCVTGKEKKCLTSGLMDVSNCYPMNAPIIASLPHFYLGNRSLLGTVNGLHPYKYVHGTFLDIEPYTGLTMQGNRRIQINVALHKIEGITAFKNCTNVYLPLMYGNKHGRISEDDADDFKTDVLLPIRLSKAAPFLLIGIGAILLCLAALISYRRHRNHTKRPTTANHEESTPLFITSNSLDQKTHRAYGYGT